MNTVLARLFPGHAENVAATREQRERREAEQVTFPDLTWDHFHWERRRRTGQCDHPEAASRYRKTRAAFEARYGEIVGEYWSITEASGIALTHRKAPLVLRPFINDTRMFHRSTDWVTRHTPPLADVLFDCENLAIRVTEVLRYTSESVGLKRIMAVASHVLGVVDRAGGKVSQAEATRVAAEQGRELREIRDYYRRAGVRIGLTVYTQGMIIGLFLMAALLTLIVVPLTLWDVMDWNTHLQEFVLSFAAGAIGAFVSVLQRMASEKAKFSVHYDLGKRTLYMLGSYRPVLGAVFGVFTYFVLVSDLVGTSPPQSGDSLYYYGALAFVAGFSERFTQVLAKSVEGLVPAQGTSDDSAAAATSDGQDTTGLADSSVASDGQVPPDGFVPADASDVQVPPDDPGATQPMDVQVPPDDPGATEPVDVQVPPDDPGVTEPIDVPAPPDDPAAPDPVDVQPPPDDPGASEPVDVQAPTDDPAPPTSQPTRKGRTRRAPRRRD
jgi:hypothetical protein